MGIKRDEKIKTLFNIYVYATIAITFTFWVLGRILIMETKMNYKKLTISTIAIFVFMFLFDWLVHGYLLTDTYMTTPSLWRSNMSDYTMWSMAINVVIAYIYSLIFNDYNSTEASKRGLIIGLLIGFTQFMKYTYMPISLSLASMLLVVNVVKGLGLGIVYSVVNNK